MVIGFSRSTRIIYTGFYAESTRKLYTRRDSDARLEGVGGNVDLAGNPGLAAVLGGEIAGHALALAEGLDVVGVGGVEDDLGVNPL